MKLLRTIIPSFVFPGLSAGSFAGQRQNANLYVNWETSAPGTYTGLSQELRITKKARGAYWAGSWNFFGANYGGYMGLQTSCDGTGGDTPFSLSGTPRLPAAAVRPSTARERVTAAVSPTK